MVSFVPIQRTDRTPSCTNHALVQHTQVVSLFPPTPDQPPRMTQICGHVRPAMSDQRQPRSHFLEHTLCTIANRKSRQSSCLAQRAHCTHLRHSTHNQTLHSFAPRPLHLDVRFTQRIQPLAVGAHLLRNATRNAHSHECARTTPIYHALGAHQDSTVEVLHLEQANAQHSLPRWVRSERYFE